MTGLQPLVVVGYGGAPEQAMKCKGCGEDVDELTAIKVNGKTKKLCEDCKSKVDEDGEIAASAESTMQGMMEFKGRR